MSKVTSLYEKVEGRLSTAILGATAQDVIARMDR